MEMRTLVKGIGRSYRSSADSKSRQHRYLGHPSQAIPLKDLRTLGLIWQAHYRELYHHRCSLLDGFVHWENSQPMKRPSSIVRSVHQHCAGSLALYLWTCLMNNGIRWLWLCISSIQAVYYRNVPSVSHKKDRIETDWYYYLFETDNSSHVSSAWTLNQDVI